MRVTLRVITETECLGNSIVKLVPAGIRELRSETASGVVPRWELPGMKGPVSVACASPGAVGSAAIVRVRA